MWAPAIKSELGDVWHKERANAADEITCFCDYRIRLDTEHSKSAPPADAYACKRCLASAGATRKR
jgi:hypothetical protein